MIVAFLFCVVDDEGIKLTADVLATCLLVDTEVVNIKCFDSVKDMTFLLFEGFQKDIALDLIIGNGDKDRTLRII